MDDEKFYRILESKNVKIRFFRFLLWLLSLVYRCIISLRSLLYRLSFFGVHKAKVPVISIGNLVLGGAGKTPLTDFVAREFGSLCKLAILSRGYGRKVNVDAVVCVSEGKGPVVTIDEAGDEPYLLSMRLKGVQIYVHPKRVKAATVAVKNGADLLILDDGFQHKAIDRDENWLVIGGRFPLGKKRLFPYGALREPLSAMSSATGIFIDEALATGGIFETICRYSDCPIIRTQTHFQGAYTHQTSEVYDLKGLKVGAFCGIGNPKGFLKILSSLGCEIVAQHRIKDHGEESLEGLQAFAQVAKEQGAKVLVCTEKDHVKYPKGIQASLDIVWVSICISISPESEEAWSVLRERVLQKLRHKASNK